MQPNRLITILVLIALAMPAPPAYAGGIVSICDEAHLLAALAGGGTVTFSCSGTIHRDSRDHDRGCHDPGRQRTGCHYQWAIMQCEYSP
jgi:hypothetical protein